MKYLVLGSAGQIGAALCSYLKEQGHEVFTWDIVDSPWQDLRYENRVDEIIEQVDFVFFLAFDVGGSKYLKTYQHTFDFINNNTKLMSVTFDALRRNSKPFIFASTQMSSMSFSSYGTLKAVGEFYAKSLGAPVVKFWNIYGIENDPAKSHVITDFVQMALDKNCIAMKTDGNEERQFLYARDCSEALLTLAKNYDKIPRDEELHVTSFNWIKVIDIARNISKLCGNIPIIPAEEKDNIQRGLRVDPDSYILQWWQPKTELEDGLKEIIKHYQNGKD